MHDDHPECLSLQYTALWALLYVSTVEICFINVGECLSGGIFYTTLVYEVS